MKQQKILINTDKCIGCGICSNICVAHNIEINNRKANTKADSCIMCGHCSAICPQNAISISNCEGDQVENSSDVRLNPKDVLDVIRFRRTIRNFKSTEIPQEIIEQILEAGRLTHTARNLQDVSFVVLNKEKDRIEKMAVKFLKTIKPIANLFSSMVRNTEIDDNFFFFNAPIVIVILAKDNTNGILAAQNMEFVAEANGLGVLYSGFFTIAANSLRKVKKAIAVPKEKKVAMTLVLGYPNVKFLRSAPRKELDVRYI